MLSLDPARPPQAGGDVDEPRCGAWAVELASAVLRGRWKLAIIYLISDGICRFADLRRALPGISAKMLSHNLRQLERDHLVTRTTETATAKGMLCVLSPLGSDLKRVLRELDTWGRAYHHQFSDAAGRHGLAALLKGRAT